MNIHEQKRTCTDPELGRLIGHYELGALNQAEREVFEEHLLRCDFCAHEVEAMHKVANAMLANRERIRGGLAEDGLTFETLKKNLMNVRQPWYRRAFIRIQTAWTLSERSPQVRIFWRAAGVAASIAVVAVVIYVAVLNKEAPTASAYMPMLSFQVLPYEGSLKLRGEQKLEGQELFDQGMDAYVQADYKKAARLLKAAASKSGDQPTWWLYLGVCHYLLHDAKAAIKELSRADELAQGIVKIRARWFLAQSELLNGNRDNAEPLLEWIIAQNRDHRDDASALLGKLRETGATGQSDRPYLLYPTGGQVFLAGSTIPLEWNLNTEQTAKRPTLWLSTDGGLTFASLLGADLTDDQTTWDWQNAKIVGSHLSLRVDMTVDNMVVHGAGTKEFAIVEPPEIHLQSPASGANWQLGFSHEIAWTCAGAWPRTCTVELYRIVTSGSAEFVETLTGDLPGTLRNWAWKDTRAPEDVPADGSDYRIKVIGGFDIGQVEGWSDGRFALAAPAVLTVETDPADQTAWIAGEPLKVAWSCSPGGARNYALQTCASEFDAGKTIADNIVGEATNWQWSNCGPPGTYLIRLIAHFPQGDVQRYTAVPITIKPRDDYASAPEMALSRTAPSGAQASEFALQQNYPNPFNASTTISFDLKTAGSVRLSVYNALGQKVATLVDGQLPMGHHQAQFDGARLASGMYLYRLESNGQVLQKQMMLTK